MKWKIRDVELQNQVVAGPMAGFSNQIFRRYAHKNNVALSVAEMVSDKALVYNNEETRRMLKVDPSEGVVSMQVFGHDIESMVKAAQIIDNECNCQIIDINMGCPVPKVIRAKAGSYLLKDVDYIYELVSSIVKNVKKPVTVKIRLGWDEKSINCVEVAKTIEKAGASAITLHARTRSKMYEGHSDWSYIKLVKESVNIPVIGNGDIKTPEDAKRMLEETGCDGVMIARGSLGNPFLFKQIVEYLDKGTYSLFTNEEKIQTCLEFARDLIDCYKNELAAMKEMRSHACWFIKGMAGSSKKRNDIHQVTTYKELEDILKNYLVELNSEEKNI